MSSVVQASEKSLVILNARVVTTDRVVEGGVRIEGDRVVDIGAVDDDADKYIEANGRLVLPGLIDLHGDDIEGHLHPRSGARMSLSMALTTADRANISAGITTKFHAISFELDKEADRSPELAGLLTDAITGSKSLLVDHRLHARCEVTQQECVNAVLNVIENGDADIVSVMSHIPGKGQFRDVEAFKQYYADSTDHTVEEAEAMIETRTDVSMARLRERVNRVIGAAHDAGAVTASHDDEDPAEVERLAETGVDITEYPITLETAQRAAEVEVTTAMGAPNLVRGESQWGNLSTADAIGANAVDVLVADYHPPSLLAAPFVETGESLPTRVRRVTANPADAVGLYDRGRIEPGARADVLIVDPDPTPAVTRAIIAGQLVYCADRGGR